MTIFTSTKNNTDYCYYIDAKNAGEAKEASRILWGCDVDFTVCRTPFLYPVARNEIITIDRNTGRLIVPPAYGTYDNDWVGQLSEW